MYLPLNKTNRIPTFHLDFPPFVTYCVTSHQLKKKKKNQIVWFPRAPHLTPLPITQSTPSFLSLADHSHSCSTFLFLFQSTQHTYTHPLPHPPTGTFLIITSTIFSCKITRKSSRTSHLHISYLR